MKKGKLPLTDDELGRKKMLLTSYRRRAEKKGKGGNLNMRKNYEERKGC
jgi:hypothetical protein